MATAAPAEEADLKFSETLNFRVSAKVKARLGAQSERLGMTQAALVRLCIHLGLEALEQLSAEPPKGGPKVSTKR